MCSRYSTTERSWVLRNQGTPSRSASMRQAGPLPASRSDDSSWRMAGSLVNDECAGRANIDHIIVAQLFGETGWTKRPVSADVATSKKSHQRH